MRAGNERWLVVKATPEQAWNTTRKFWQDIGLRARGRAIRSSASWKPTGRKTARRSRATSCARRSARSLDVFYSTYKRDKFRTRIEHGTEPGTVEIYISHRGMEQVPTARSTTRRPRPSRGP